MTKPLDTAIFLQARISSRRLPGKVLKKIYGKPVLGYLIERLLTTGLPVWLLYPKSEAKAFSGLKSLYPEVSFFGADKYNVLKRFYDAVKSCPAHNYVRVTGDNPFTSINCLKSLLKKHIEQSADFSFYKNLPYGAGVEIMSRRSLNFSYRYGKTLYQKEHVTPWLHKQVVTSNSKFLKTYITLAPKKYRYPELRVTIDTEADIRLFRQRIKLLRERNLSFSLSNLLTVLMDKS